MIETGAFTVLNNEREIIKIFMAKNLTQVDLTIRIKIKFMKFIPRCPAGLFYAFFQQALLEIDK
jgi:hypothetical protein